MVDPIAFLTLSQNRKTSTINVWTMIEHGEYITEVWSALYFGGLYGGLYFERVLNHTFFRKKQLQKSQKHGAIWNPHGHMVFRVSLFVFKSFDSSSSTNYGLYHVIKHLLTILKPTFFAFISHEQPFWTMVILGTNHWLTAGCTATGAKSLSLPCRPGKMGISWRPWCKLQN